MYDDLKTGGRMVSSLAQSAQLTVCNNRTETVTDQRTKESSGREKGKRTRTERGEEES